MHRLAPKYGKDFYERVNFYNETLIKPATYELLKLLRMPSNLASLAPPSFWNALVYISVWITNPRS